MSPATIFEKMEAMPQRYKIPAYALLPRSFSSYLCTVAKRIILGIDPGTTITGYGIIACEGRQMELVTCGVLRLGRVSTEHAEKLKRIFERVSGLIKEFKPTEVAIEAPFQGKNVQSMLKLGRAQGVAMAAAMVNGLDIVEYPPKKVKMAVTGNGNASKQMMCSMLEKMLHFDLGSEAIDASDGLAVAVCHFYQNANHAATKSYGGWAAFVKDNPNRVG